MFLVIRTARRDYNNISLFLFLMYGTTHWIKSLISRKNWVEDGGEIESGLIDSISFSIKSRRSKGNCRAAGSVSRFLYRADNLLRFNMWCFLKRGYRRERLEQAQTIWDLFLGRITGRIWLKSPISSTGFPLNGILGRVRSPSVLPIASRLYLCDKTFPSHMNRCICRRSSARV